MSATEAARSDYEVYELVSGKIQDRVRQEEVARRLYDDFLPKIRGVLKEFGVDGVSAEQLANEAMEKGSLSYQPGKAKFITYVTKIAINLSLDRRKKGLLPSQVHERLDDDSKGLQERVGKLDPDQFEDEEAPRDVEFVNKVNGAIQKMSDEERVLIQFDIQGVEKESYMGLYGVSAEAYRQRKSRAYRRLRDLFESSSN